MSYIKGLCVFCLSIILSCNSSDNGFEEASLHKCEYMLLSSDVQLLDVRTYDEYKYDWIEGAVLIDSYSNNFVEKLDTFNKNQRLIVYCSNGTRSSKVCSLLVSHGFSKVFKMKGGIEGWNIHGKKLSGPVEDIKK